MTATATSYDELPYESNPFLWTHPDRLATIARLFGLQAPPVDRCRLLELGCASGGNLIPMAVNLPQSRFVGVDLSGRQIADGQKVVSALGLTNIELKPISISDVDADLGEFDYILCHGVYSWVPAQVQDKILEICTRQLARTGVAYVSYNTYPGWYMRRMIRDILYYHAKQYADPHIRVQQARLLLQFLAQSVPVQENSVYPSLLKGAAEVFRQQSDFYLLHEYLEEVNEPLYFHQFIDRVAAKGLRYIADSKFIAVPAGALAPAIEQTLSQFSSDRLAREQYLDFLSNQAFRRALLCRREIELNQELQPEAIALLHVASSAQPTSGAVSIFSVAPDFFRRSDGATVSVNEPLVKAALVHLAEKWPQSVPFDTLCARARGQLGSARAQDAATPSHDVQTLSKGLLRCYLANLVELHVLPVPCAHRPAERPVANGLARYQAAFGPRVTNLRHEVIVLDDLQRQLLQLLDGSRAAPILRSCSRICS
jgi:methyltransferase-like protein/2-polyprenyl-3-methyl-5-hydroxy-6-metoxy-1,4-benzoquinol methylase